MTKNHMHPDLPRTARLWPEWVQDRVAERIAIMREGNNVPDRASTPPAIQQEALKLAEELMGGAE